MSLDTFLVLCVLQVDELNNSSFPHLVEFVNDETQIGGLRLEGYLAIPTIEKYMIDYLSALLSLLCVNAILLGT